MPKISVIVPIYGVEKYIERCARSLFEQTLDDIEYIFVDDCSPDNSLNILDSVIRDYPGRKNQIHIIQHNANKGLPFARKSGLEVATGEYVAHCDSDDWIDHDMYQIMYEKAQKENAEIVVCDFIRTNGTSFKKRVKACACTNVNTFINDCVYQKNSWALWNKIYKRELYSDIFIYPQETMGEDMVLCFQLLARCQKISYVSLPLYNYFYNMDSVSKKNTIEACERNYYSLKSNVNIVVDLMKKGLIPVENLDLSVGFLRFINSLTLVRVLYLKRFKKLWKQECEELPIVKFLVSRNVPLYCKKVFVLVYFGIIPLKSNRI